MFFSELLETYPQLKEYTQHMPRELRHCDSLRSLPAGYLIHQKDDRLETVGILCEGTLKVINEFQNGNAFMIEHNTPIDIIGDVTVLAGRERTSVTIETVTPCTVLFLSRADFDGWLREDCHLLRVMSRKVANKLYQSSYTRGAEVFYSSPRLMLEFLRRQMEPDPPAPGADRVLPHTRQQLSEQLGMTRKTVDRTIGRLKELGLIDTSKGKIQVRAEQHTAILRRLEEWID